MSKSEKKPSRKASVFSSTYRGSAVPHLSTNKGSVFLSYNSADRSLAKQVAERLSAAGYLISNGDDVVEPGANWLEAVGRALNRADAVVFFLSRTALRARSTSLELDFVLSTRKFKNRVVPVLIDTEPTEVPWIVRHLPFVSTGKRDETDADAVAKSVRKELDQRL